jgi:hypothetical protein
MKHDQFGLKPPNYSYVDMLERMTDGLHVDVVNLTRADDRGREKGRPRHTVTVHEKNRPSSQSNPDEQG